MNAKSRVTIKAVLLHTYLRGGYGKGGPLLSVSRGHILGGFGCRARSLESSYCSEFVLVVKQVPFLVGIAISYYTSKRKTFGKLIWILWILVDDICIGAG